MGITDNANNSFLKSYTLIVFVHIVLHIIETFQPFASIIAVTLNLYVWMVYLKRN